MDLIERVEHNFNASIRAGMESIPLLAGPVAEAGDLMIPLQEGAITEKDFCSTEFILLMNSRLFRSTIITRLVERANSKLPPPPSISRL